MGRFLVLAMMSVLLQSVTFVQADGPDGDINLDDDTLTQEEIMFLFEYLGLDSSMATNFTDMIMKDGDTNADGVIEQTEMKTWV